MLGKIIKGVFGLGFGGGGSGNKGGDGQNQALPPQGEGSWLGNLGKKMAERELLLMQDRRHQVALSKQLFPGATTAELLGSGVGSGSAGGGSQSDTATAIKIAKIQAKGQVDAAREQARPQQDMVGSLKDKIKEEIASMKASSKVDDATVDKIEAEIDELKFKLEKILPHEATDAATKTVWVQIRTMIEKGDLDLNDVQEINKRLRAEFGTLGPNITGLGGDIEGNTTRSTISRLMIEVAAWEAIRAVAGRLGRKRALGLSMEQLKKLRKRINDLKKKTSEKPTQ